MSGMLDSIIQFIYEEKYTSLSVHLHVLCILHEGCCVSEPSWYLSFLHWLISLNILVWGWDNLLQMVKFHSFHWLSSIPWSICTNFFIHCSFNGHLGYFQVFTIVDCVINTGLQVTFSFADFTSFGHIPRNKKLDHMKYQFSVVLAPLGFHSGCTSPHSPISSG